MNKRIGSHGCVADDNVKFLGVSIFVVSFLSVAGPAGNTLKFILQKDAPASL